MTPAFFSTLLFSLLLTTSPGPETGLQIDGSSTVQPLTAAIAQLYQRNYPGRTVEVSAHGTSAGLEKLISGRIPVAQASRRLTPRERAEALSNGIEIDEIMIAWDGITLVVPPENTFASDLTLDELKKIWLRGSKVTRWSDIRPQWPSIPIELIGPGEGHGTTDFFDEALSGNGVPLRGDRWKAASDDYAEMVTAVKANRGALGFITYAYYVKNFQSLKAIAISSGSGPAVFPTYANITDRKYVPFSRPLFLYVARKELHRREVADFVDFYLNTAYALVRKVGYVPLDREAYRKQRDQLLIPAASGTAGTQGLIQPGQR